MKCWLSIPIFEFCHPTYALLMPFPKMYTIETRNSKLETTGNARWPLIYLECVAICVWRISPPQMLCVSSSINKNTETVYVNTQKENWASHSFYIWYDKIFYQYHIQMSVLLKNSLCLISNNTGLTKKKSKWKQQLQNCNFWNQHPDAGYKCNVHNTWRGNNLL